MSKVSVIVPVYNMEKYLEECMESLLEQSLEDIEVICVDDGSKDKSAELLDVYVKKDKRVKVFRKENTGYGDSVNMGMRHAQGEYIGIVEPDDYVSSDMYEKLYETANEEGLEVVKGNFSEFWGEKGERRFVNKKVIDNQSYYTKVLTPSKDYELFRGYIINPAGIYQRKFLMDNAIFHNTTKGASYQDIGFWFQVMALTKKMRLVDAHLYFYRQDNEGSSINSREKVFCICDEYKFLYDFMMKNKKKINGVMAYYLYCMLASYRTNYNRVAVSYKKEFVQRAHADFFNLQEQGLIDTCILNAGELEELRIFLYEPKELYRNSIKEAENLHNRLKQYEKAIIYGAGNIGRNLLLKMYGEDYEKVEGFAVTSMEGELPQISGKKVRNINAYSMQKDRLAVVVGVSKQYQAEVLETLKRKSFPNVIMVDM